MFSVHAYTCVYICHVYSIYTYICVCMCYVFSIYTYICVHICHVYICMHTHIPQEKQPVGVVYIILDTIL
jgi:hypothetical protein